jgi:O-antigen/teichoic acid export membrane protein
MIVMVPVAIMSRLMGGVFYPVISESHRRSPDGLVQKLRSVRTFMGLAGVLGATLVALLAPTFFRLLYSPEYWEAGRMAQLLSPIILFRALNGSLNAVLLAVGDSRGSAIANTARLVGGSGLMVLGWNYADTTGLIVAVGLAGLIDNTIDHVLLKRHGIRLVGQDIFWLLLGASLLCSVYFIHESQWSL